MIRTQKTHEKAGQSRESEDIKRRVGAARTKFSLRQKKRKFAEMRFYNDMSECKNCGMYYDLTALVYLIASIPHPILLQIQHVLKIYINTIIKNNKNNLYDFQSATLCFEKLWVISTTTYD